MVPRLLLRSARRRSALALLAAATLSPCAGTAGEAAVQAPLAAAASDYHHTRWTAEEGAPPAIQAMAQTADGWLWLGTLDGLYRFDGVHFARYPLPPGLGLNRNLIHYLHAGPRGELYIGRTAEGLSVLYPDGRVEALAGPTRGKPINGVALDGDGSVWVVSAGLHRLRAGRWQSFAGPDAPALQRLRSLMVDGQGRVWLAAQERTWRLDPRTGRFEQVLDAGGELQATPDGRLWLVTTGGALRPLPQDGAAAGPPPSLTGASGDSQFAPDGSLWMLGCPDRPCFVPDAARRAGGMPLRAGAVGIDTPLSGKTPGALLVDREGDLWISTENGLDRFRRKRIIPTELAGEGLPYSLVADADGHTWAAHAGSGRMWELRPDGVRELTPRHPVTVLARDAAGRLLMGGRRSIWREDGDGVHETALPPGPDGKPADVRMLGILDDGKLLWTSTFETGLIAWKDGRWHPRAEFKLPAKIYQSARAAIGQHWLATGDGELFRFDVERNATHPPIDIRALGMTAAIFAGPELLLSGDNGSGIVRDGKLSMLQAADPNSLRNVSGMVATRDGDRWLNGAAGLVHVRAADWQRSIADPSLPLRYELFDRLDGYPGRAVFESRRYSAWSADGHTLWLVGTAGVARVDTASLARNRVPPVPVILSLSTDRAAYAAGAPLRLAPGTDRFRVDFTSPALRMPERVRFQTMLEGVDRGWQDAGTRRTTSYTSVVPGDYLFRLRAINEDGVASAQDAVLRLSVAPTMWQTIWFKVLAVAMLALLLVLAYRYRVRYLTRRVAERMGVRMAERERIARTLHDSFLQTVHSLLLRVDAIAAGLPKGDGARRELETAIDLAKGALGEGRQELEELRGDGKEDLAAALGDIARRLQALHAGVTIGLRIDGQARPLRAEVAGEAAAIAREALHNACRHAGADQVRAVLDYAPGELVLSVRDDGRGIDAAVLDKGAAEGRWGLVGMRERAGRIGARLEIGAGAEGGTVVRLSVPAAQAYAG